MSRNQDLMSEENQSPKSKDKLKKGLPSSLSNVTLTSERSKYQTIIWSHKGPFQKT